MRHQVVVLSTWLLGLASTVSSAGLVPNRFQLVPPPVRDERQASEKTKRAEIQSGVFDQLIDHSRPELGTFPQRFWWSTEFYDGPGSPVLLFTPGEVSAEGYDGYLTNRTLPGLFANATGAAGILLEHRYWGESSPVADYSIANMQHLTLRNSIRDLTHFANSVSLPFDPEGLSKPRRAPWILTGGSYSGALAAWTSVEAPGTFWAYHASSAVVEAVDDFWHYFVPVQEGMPKNCSADVERVIGHVDKVLVHGGPKEKWALKKKFGLESLTHDDDFASAIESGPWTWQSHSESSGYNDFDEFCDYVENVWPESNQTAPGPEGVGLAKALDGYTKWMKEVLLPGSCKEFGYQEWQDELSTACFDTYNETSPMYTDTSLDNAFNRQWMWFLCNEPFKFWQDGAPKGKPTLVSRLVKPDYWERQCGLYFPPTGSYSYGIARGEDVDDVNAWTGGWDAYDDDKTKRIMFANGQWDPWRDATVSSITRPGGPLEGTEERPNWLIEGGIHCSDLSVRNGVASEAVGKVQADEVEVMTRWVNEFYEEKNKTRSARADR